MEVAARHTVGELKLLQLDKSDATLWQRRQIILLAKLGWTAPAIAMGLSLSRRAVQDWVYRYNDQGLNGLIEQRGRMRRCALTPEQEEQFRQRVDARATPADQVCSLRGRDFQRILKNEYGILRSLAAIYKLLHRLKYSSLRPRPRHRLADPQKQAEFIADLPARVAAIAKEHSTKRIRLMWQDEARFGQQGTTTNVWATTNTRPEVVRQTEYQYVWVMAAVCPETGLSEGLICPRMNAAYVNAFLEQLSARIPDDEHVVMLWDGAGFHRSGKIIMPANITAIQLPAYSPELNPIENLWHYLKSHYWSNRAYDDADDLEQAVMDAWKVAVDVPDLMKTVCAATIYQRAALG